MFIIGIPIAVVVAYLFMHASTVGDPMSAIMRARMFYGLVLALLFGAIGFLDDYLKVVKKQNEGLTEKQKMARRSCLARCTCCFCTSAARSPLW